MKTIARILAFTLVMNLLAPTLCLAQQSVEINIAQLREQIAKLEKIDLDPDASPEVKALNHEFLKKRRTELSDLISRRINALRQYLTTMGDMLTPQERQTVENSILALSAELRDSGSEAKPVPGSVIKASAELPASATAVPTVNSAKETVYNISVIPTTATVPEVSDSLPSSKPAPKLPRQGKGGTNSSSGKDDKNSLTINIPPSEIPRPKEVENGTVVTVKGTIRPDQLPAVSQRRSR